MYLLKILTIPLSDDFAGILGPRWGGIFDPGSTPRVGSLEGETGDEKTASDRWPKTGKIIGKGYIFIKPLAHFFAQPTYCNIVNKQRARLVFVTF